MGEEVGFRPGLLLLAVLVVVAVCVQNVWLRRRAERERGDAEDEEPRREGSDLSRD